jgi:hypothetical protein
VTNTRVCRMGRVRAFLGAVIGRNRAEHVELQVSSRRGLWDSYPVMDVGVGSGWVMACVQRPARFVDSRADLCQKRK